MPPITPGMTIRRNRRQLTLSQRAVDQLRRESDQDEGENFGESCGA
jgi:hypothetical protein